MAITRTTFVKGRMNKSVDERLVPPGEYIDALNVRLGSTETTEIGAVENSKGNSRLTELQFGGEFLNTVGYGEVRTIGCFEDGINETIYWFVHQEDNPNSVITGIVDMIVSFNTNNNTLVYHVISTQVLNFSFTYLITGVSKIEDLLFFTDDLNPPRTINVTRDYPYPVGGLDNVLEEEDISVIVKPPGFEDYDTVSPLGTPSIEPFILPDEQNYMSIRFLSFAYRYRYLDGQYSATSLFSTPVFDPVQFDLSNANLWNSGMENEFNACRVTFSTGSKRVTEVDLLYKESTSNSIFVINRYVKEKEGWSDNDFQTIQFSNSEIYTVIGQDELFRLYDNVPRIAKAQTIQGNRLMYGNYVDGYDVKAVKNGSDLRIDYQTSGYSVPFNDELVFTADSSSLSAGNYTIGGAFTEQDSIITFDLADVAVGGAVIPQGTTIGISLQMNQTTPTVCVNTGTASECSNVSFQNSPFIVTLTFTCPTAYPDVNSILVSDAFRNRIGGSVADGFPATSVLQSLYPCNESNQGSTLSDKFYALAASPMTGTSLYLVSGGIDNTACPVADLNTTPFPLICGDVILITSSTTDNITGFLTDNTADFIASNIVVGNVITDSSSGNQSIITSVTTTQLGLTVGSPGESQLELSGVDYQISSGGGNIALCPADGFLYNTNATNPALTPTQFTLQVPATQWFFGDGDSTTDNFSEAYRYYNFTAEGCIATKSTTPSRSSLHSNRDYEVGIVYMDEYGRASTVLTSLNSTMFFNAGTSTSKNQIKINLSSLPPYWAKKYKFVVKPGQGNYDTIYSKKFYRQDGLGSGTTSLPIATTNDPSLVWFKLEGQNQNILKVGDELIVKNDSNGATQTEIKTVILHIQAFSGGGISQLQNSEAGLYMLLKPQGWVADNSQDTSYIFGQQEWSNGFSNSVLTSSYMASQGAPFGETYTPFANTDGNPSSNPILAVALQLNGVAPTPTTFGYPLFDITTQQNYPIPAGTSIKISLGITKGKQGIDCTRSMKYERTFISGYDYPDFAAWSVGDDLSNNMLLNSSVTSPGFSNIIGNMNFGFINGVSDVNIIEIPNFQIPNGGINNVFSTIYACVAAWGGSLGSAFGRIQKDVSGKDYFVIQGNQEYCTNNIFDHYPAHASFSIEIKTTSQEFCFETVPGDVDENLFYDASDLLEIEPSIPGTQAFHKAKRDFDPVTQTYGLSTLSQDQTSTQEMVTLLDAYNCYSFGNGVESYKIYDSPAGKSFNLGERTLAVSNQDFKEADRYASITYSGVYNNQSNINNLNEFNLGLLNFKDCNQIFGPIQLLHARRLDTLTLQEDRITYVYNDKNLLSDAVGGGAVVSIPQVLGQQISRIEEYGISFNPESFVSWGSDMFFTDTKRGVVINLRGSGEGMDQLQVVSRLGMNSWFRDSFTAQLTTQKLGGYDPYMNEYVLGTNLRIVPTPLDKIPCGRRSSFNAQSNTVSYEVELGLTVGTVNIPYNITSGEIDITILWNDSTAASVTNAIVSGVLTFNKILNSPSTCTVVITPNLSSNFDLSVDCPIQKNITVIEVVVNSNNYNGQFIHTSYTWTDGVNISPSTGFSSAELKILQPAEYESNTGIRSLGVFPYTGASITLKTNKFGIDDFIFNPEMHKFKILSSNTLYSNSATDVDSLIIASSEVTPITNPTTDVYQAIESSFNIPDANQYLYLIWDLRSVSSQNVCYCPKLDAVDDVCCNCNIFCKNVFIGPRASTQTNACLTDIDTPQKGDTNRFSFIGNLSIPTVGDIVYQTNNCSLPTKTPGFYIISGVSPSVLPKRWMELNNVGIVISEGTC